MSVRYISSLSQAESVLHNIGPLPSHIGLDIEWKPNYVKNTPENPVSLIQIATDADVYLFHLARIRAFPQSLRQILINPFITKSGVGIQYDVRKLWSDCAVSVSSCVDLSLLAHSIDSTLFAHRLGESYSDIPLYPQSLPHGGPYDPYEHRIFRGPFKNPIGLARFARIFQGIELEKGRTARSNWELPLSPQQIKYAAADATTSYSTYYSLLNLLAPIPPQLCPKRKYFMFDSIRGTNYLPILPEERLSPSTLTLHPPNSAFSDTDALSYLHTHTLAPWSIANPEYDPAPRPIVQEDKKEKKPEKKPENGRRRRRGA